MNDVLDMEYFKKLRRLRNEVFYVEIDGLKVPFAFLTISEEPPIEVNPENAEEELKKNAMKIMFNRIKKMILKGYHLLGMKEITEEDIENMASFDVQRFNKIIVAIAEKINEVSNDFLCGQTKQE